jgi:hypothetical protein
MPLQEIELRELDAKDTEKYRGLLQAKLAELENKGTQFKEFPGQRLPVPPDEVK